MSRKGFIYVMTNKSMPGLVKIGMTTQHPEIRASDLSSTGVPTPFQVEYYAAFDDMKRAETLVHRKLGSVRESRNREFFRISVPKAVTVIENTNIPFKRHHHSANCQSNPVRKVEAAQNVKSPSYFFRLVYMCIISPLIIGVMIGLIFMCFQVAEVCTTAIAFLLALAGLDPPLDMVTLILAGVFILAAQFLFYVRLLDPICNNAHRFLRFIGFD